MDKNMDAVSVCTNFEYYPPSCTDEFDGTYSARRRFDGKKELRKKLKATVKRNEELEGLLAVNTHEIDELKNSLRTLNEVLNIDEKKPNNIASTKIIELSKKNRQLKAELESTKSKYSKIDAKLDKLEKEIAQNDFKKSLDSKLKKTNCCHNSVNIEQLEEQLNSTKQKLFEALNLNTELRNNMKLAQKCLQQEIGENFNLNLLATANSNWRGRAQQIMSLQNKVSELKQRLEGGSTLSDDPSRLQIRKLEANRKDLQEDLQVQVKNLTATNEAQKIKISALIARNKNLVDETMNYKLKTLNLMEQSGINDTSIATINEKLNIQKYHHENKVKELTRQIEEANETRKNAEIEHSRTQLKYESCENLIQTKQDIINELNEIIQRYDNDLKMVCGDFLFSCRDLKKSEFLAILDSLESEKNGLTKYNKELTERFDTEKEKVRLTTETIAKMKIKISRLEAKIKDQQKEYEILLGKKKRNQRITDYSNNLSSRLSVSALLFENSNSAVLENTSQVTNTECTLDGVDIDDLKNKLEFLKEKVDYLEGKLKITQNEKESDTKIFNEIMSNSKNILLNMIQKVKINSDLEYRNDMNSANDLDDITTNRSIITVPQLLDEATTLTSERSILAQSN